MFFELLKSRAFYIPWVSEIQTKEVLVEHTDFRTNTDGDSAEASSAKLVKRLSKVTVITNLVFSQSILNSP